MQNLLGYSNRKLKRYDLALAYYQKALELQPKHRGANNYVAATSIWKPVAWNRPGSGSRCWTRRAPSAARTTVTCNGPSRDTLLCDAAGRLGSCLERLRDRQRQCIAMIYWDGVTYQQLADKLNTPQGTVKVWVRRGLEKLRQCLEQ